MDWVLVEGEGFKELEAADGELRFGEGNKNGTWNRSSVLGIYIEYNEEEKEEP